MSNQPSLPKTIKVIAWLFIAGAIWKLAMTPFSWSQFEIWRNIFLLLMKCSALAAGVLLLKGYKQGAIIYITITALNTVVFYSHPPDIAHIERYFTSTAIALAICAPIVFIVLISLNWKALKWRLQGNNTTNENLP